jgi:23S rRNA-/tRNA-specific pseudouridylate synthase
LKSTFGEIVAADLTLKRKSVQEILEFLVEEEDRLDRFLARAYPDFSRNYLQRLIEEGYVLVENQVITKPSKRLKPGEKGFTFGARARALGDPSRKHSHKDSL